MLHYKDFDDKDYAVSSDAVMMASYRQDAFSDSTGSLLRDSFSLRDDEQLLVKFSYRFEL